MRSLFYFAYILAIKCIILCAEVCPINSSVFVATHDENVTAVYWTCKHTSGVYSVSGQCCSEGAESTVCYVPVYRRLQQGIDLTDG